MTARAAQQSIALTAADEHPTETVGQKARTLGMLARHGLPVPDGFVLAAPWVAEASETELRAVLSEALERLGGSIAVRSSAVAEDTSERSFAGQYETVLSVEDLEDLVEAVATVLGSATSERVEAYGGTGSPMAVLLQRMVPAASAGVAFTADPVTGERDVIVVSSVSGLGDRLVSGEADPDEWEVRDGSVAPRRTPESSLTEQQVLQVAALAGRAAGQLGSPQDIEWAFDGDQVHLLQARPITGLPEVEPIEPEIEPPEEGFWMLDGGHYPSPMSPMGASFYLPALDSAASEAFRDWGLLLERIENRVIGWRVYGRMVPIGGKEGGPTPPAWLMGILARVVPPIRRQAKKAEEAFESGRIDQVIDRWWEEWRPEFQSRIEELGAVELSRLDDGELLAHLDETIAFFSHGQRIHFELFPPYIVPVAETIRFCQERLGWSKQKATDLLGGLSTMSAEPARRLHDLAKLARSRPEIAELLDGEASLDDLRQADTELAGKLDEYLGDFGLRATAYDVLAPTLGEQDDLLLAALGAEADYDPAEVERRQADTRERLLQEARSELSRDQEALARFEELTSKAEKAYPVREDNIFFTDNAPVGLVRLAALEIGRRLTNRELLDEPEHIFFLTVDETLESFRSGINKRDLIHRRRGEREWALRHAPAPAFGEDPGPPPDMSAMPKGVRRMMEAVGFSMEHDLFAATGDGLSGTPASSGTYTGTARVVLSESEFGRVRPGDVLVCPITTPSWSVLFGQIGGLVTDTGGMLSHSAIVAREHGIPAVVATGSGTTRIPDGATVTVDGASGNIEVHQ
jgi:phosphohistidine swiveling domain-containing protein